MSDLKKANIMEFLKDSSIASAIDSLSIKDLSALIEVLNQKRQEKIEAAEERLLLEFRAKATELGIPFKPPLRSSERTSSGKRSNVGVRVPAKYRSPNGEEWSGRGRTPSWLKMLEAKGRNRQEFIIP